MFSHSTIAKARAHTFDAITSYVVDNLPNLQDASRVAAKATVNIMSSEVYLSLEEENILCSKQLTT